MRYAPTLTKERNSDNRSVIPFSLRRSAGDSSAIHPLPGVFGERIQYAPTLTDEGSRSILRTFIPIRGYSEGIYNRYLCDRLKVSA